MDKEREESKNINDFIRDLEGLIVFIETFFERLEQEKMGIEEPLGILKHLLSMLNREKEKWEKKVKKVVSKLNKEYEKIPIKCQICEFFLEDDEFVKEYKTKFVCSFDGDINPKFPEFCDVFEIGKWELVGFLTRISGEKK